MCTDRGTDASQKGVCPVCQHTPLYCDCGTASANALAIGRERWPNQPIPGCCGFTRPTGQCCVETNVPSGDEEEEDGEDRRS